MKLITLFTLLVAFYSSLSLAQNCESAISQTTPDSRYINNGNGTVSDKVTGLMWKQCIEGLSGNDCSTGNSMQVTWDLALQQAQTQNATGGFAGYTDWRLPNIKELLSLVERKCYDPAINVTLFPNADYWNLWSSSPYPKFTSHSWMTLAFYGEMTGMYRGAIGYVRLVRAGQ